MGVNPVDIQEIEGKLHEILFDDVFCNEVARQCYERASAFSWHNSAKMYYEVFIDLLNNKFNKETHKVLLIWL